ncbi:uncharacterized protein SPAPADRAFT_48102 [Spathaspora passalidarum NRRL Y-27907]|uniref:Rad21/Rec8-like protein N-terminal domain-containing protein n=1 Tax=Spathaspora passalidarum (strain NRRL Y-27907 / 11-Y1) TaxID=619300 RepID=G3AFR2_SPAPN|nr:uncharacterized protein SPAPADRAFT_48102 [Spathaspora passalidarum NRRL Y-27907]EGW35051.1 hypothetical protein SPAPADRAFT_48102 [Spathaspora passalidarum NRRL Y-27907]
MELIQDRSPGLEIAWMLATLGNKAAKNRTRREINSLSIPKLCEELHEAYSQYGNIRYSSNILHGISIIHRHKVNYFYNDVSMVRDRLRQTNAFRILMNTTSCSDTLVPSKRTHHLQDVNFRIDIDLSYPLEDEEDRSGKRRRIKLQNDDSWGFTEANSTSELTQPEQSEQEAIDQFIGRLEADQSIEMDIDFNLDGGNGVEADPERDQQPEADTAVQNLIDDLILQTVGEANQENQQEASISNDPNFHLSTSNNFQTIEETTTTVPYQKMKVDEETMLSRAQMIKAVEEYETRMVSKENQKSDEAKRLDAIIQAINFDFSAYSDYVHRMIFQNEYRNGRQLRRNSFLDNTLLSNKATTLMEEESELARRASRENLEDEPQLNLDLNNFQQVDIEVPRSQEDIFNISFGDALRNSSSSRAPTERTDISAYSDNSTTEKTTFGRQLRKFFKYTKDRAQVLGAKFISSDYGLNNLSEAREISGLKLNKEYSQILFSDLVPNNTSAMELDEEPMIRKHAANSFSNILNLASRNLLAIQITPAGSFDLLQPSSIEIIVQVEDDTTDQ